MKQLSVPAVNCTDQSIKVVTFHQSGIAGGQLSRFVVVSTQAAVTLTGEELYNVMALLTVVVWVASLCCCGQCSGQLEEVVGQLWMSVNPCVLGSVLSG